jgi:hypothetical protein
MGQLDEFKEIAKVGDSDTLAMVASVMDANAREQEWLANTIQAGLERERDKWKERALDAEAQLRKIEMRVMDLIYG